VCNIGQPSSTYQLWVAIRLGPLTTKFDPQLFDGVAPSSAQMLIACGDFCLEIERMFWIEKLFQLLEPLVGTEKLFFPILNLVQSCADHVIAHGHDRPVEVCSLHTAFRRCVQYPHFAGTAEKPSVEKDSTKCGGIAG